MVSFIFFVSNKMCSCRNQFFYSFFIYISFKSELNLNSENYFFDVNANLLCQIKSFIFLFILILNKAIFFCQDMSCSLFHFTYNCHLCFFVVFQIKKKKTKKNALYIYNLIRESSTYGRYSTIILNNSSITNHRNKIQQYSGSSQLRCAKMAF